MRALTNGELDLVSGGRAMARQTDGARFHTQAIQSPNSPVPSLEDPIDPAYWENDFGTQIGAAPPSSGAGGSGGVTLTPAERAGLSDATAAKLIGWIEALGAATDPATALGAGDVITGFSDVELEKATMSMKMYCTDHDEGWTPGPSGSPGECTQ